ncbi:hypothetical protein [Streptacidiphilus sp. EB103A]|uniref:hypothetical protein n=1 Tax=Streptacidiphilus sp. EB103A TaxID=3156275 RepID=UPI003518BF04
MADDDWEQTVTRAFIGTRQTAGRVRWIWEKEDGRRRLGRMVSRSLTTAFGLWSAYALGTHWPWVGAAEIIALLCYGHAKARLEETELPEAAEDEQAEDAAQPVTARPMPSPAEIRQLLIDSVRHLAGERQGVHLDQLHAVWSLDGDLEMDLSEFRRWVEAHGVPVRDSLKASGKTRIGIHLSDLPASAAETPPPVVPDELLQDW